MSFAGVEPITKDHLTAEFDCGSIAQTVWLRKVALQAHRADTARVYVATHVGDPRVVGYYALSAAGVERVRVPARIGMGSSDPVPAFLLARLGVDLREQGRGLGRGLVKDALLRAAAAADTIGARALLIHCETEQARAFYQGISRRFEPSPTDPLHLWLLMKDLRATIAFVAGVS